MPTGMQTQQLAVQLCCL